jgi:hypothetical protein
LYFSNNSFTLSVGFMVFAFIYSKM